jgi:hypothetical protein
MAGNAYREMIYVLWTFRYKRRKFIWLVNADRENMQDMYHGVFLLKKKKV